MVAYSFHRRFAEPILDGRKGGTIRPDRRRHARPGEELQLYTGMRTKQCRLITRQHCVAVDPITLDFVTRSIEWPAEDRLIYRSSDLDRFAVFDGFRCYADMIEFWAETHATDKFHGWHIRWLAHRGLRPTREETAKE
jgi:uncharacterized protein YqfB (UPF0267 family)